MNRPVLLLLFLILLPAAACDRRPATAPQTANATPPTPPTNRIDIPPIVRQNLGITFATVERRAITRTLRIPGRFELLPTARREYRAAAPGHLDLLVQQFEHIQPGQPLYRIDSPLWRQLQRELTDAQAAITLAQAAADSIGPFIEAHDRHHTALETAVELWSQRLATLEELAAAGAARGEELAQARAALASARAALAETFEKEAELAVRQREVHTQLAAARSRFDILLREAASLAGMDPDSLAAAEPPPAGEPLWRTLGPLEIRAASAGIVEALHLTTGAYADQHAPILSTVRPEQIRFRAHALQSDLGRISGDLPARIVAASSAINGEAGSIPGAITIAPIADPQRRTIELIITPTIEPPATLPSWARPGISAFVEITTASGATRVAEDLAIPLAAVVRDGPQRIIFRRDPANPDKAIRLEADLGLDDGRYIQVKSGLAEGNQVVLDGAYQLMAATSGTITKGGHFHADGTFHEGPD